MPPQKHTRPEGRSEDDATEAAVRWLREVDGRLMCKHEAIADGDGWVAIVKTPAQTGGGAQVILAFGSTALAAVETAQERWDDAWRDLSAIH